jgi:hypothetical protein
MKTIRNQCIALLVVAGGIAACNQPATKIAAAVEYDDAWQLQSLIIKANDKTRIVDAAHELTFVVSDDTAGSPLTFEMWGLVGDANKKAYAKVDVTPVLDDTVDATLSLKLLDCSTPCTVGAVRCDGDAGVATCLAVEGCGVWSQPVACPSVTPFCSAGICAATCTDECTMGTVQCDGTGATETCGQADADSCLDWQAPVACPAAQTCSGAGLCSSTCTDDCTAGATRCDGTTGVQTCGQADADSCLEWQPSTACPAMQACSANACRPVMTCDNPTPVWKKETPATRPTPRSSAAMAYDVSRQKMVLFGGFGAGRLADTWTWDGSDWTLEAPGSSPLARSGHAMADDTVRQKVVLFGGFGNGIRVGDTWTWNGSDWGQPASNPTDRFDHAMAYDAARQEIVLFGGFNSSSLGDTLIWTGSSWSQETTEPSPSARSDHSMAYDIAGGQTVLFGGVRNGTRFDDTWTWNGTGWTLAFPASSPSAREGHAMAYDSAHQTIVLFGGLSNGGRLGQTWTWNGSNWNREAPAVSPTAREEHAMAYDASRRQIVLFGGFDGSNYLNDTWTLDWTCP